MAHPSIVMIASACVERAEALGYRGKRRDAFALDYFVGAHAGCTAAGNPDLASHIGAITAYVIAVRGFAYVEELANHDLSVTA